MVAGGWRNLGGGVNAVCPFVASGSPAKQVYSPAVAPALPLCLAALVTAAPAGDPHLEEGIQRYEARDYAGALGALTQALDTAQGARPRARVHIYIGLIQFAYQQTRDAENSFAEALALNPRARLPREAPKGAQKLFARLKGPAPERPGGRRPPPKDARPDEDDPPDEGEAPPPVEVPGADPKDAPPAGPPPPPPAMVPPSPPLTVSGPGPAEPGVNVPAWVVASAGAAALITGAVVSGVSASTAQRAQDEPVAARAEALYQDAVTQRTAGFITLGVGAVAAGVAAYLFLAED
jgi:hypothetical protein